MKQPQPSFAPYGKAIEKYPKTLKNFYSVYLDNSSIKDQNFRLVLPGFPDFFLEENVVVLTTAELQDLLTQGKAGLLVTPKVGLFENNPVLTQATVLADLTPITIAGLAVKTVVWDANGVSPVGDAVAYFGLVTFQATTTVGLPITANGWYLVDVTGAILLAAEFFGTPFLFPDELTQLNFAVPFTIPNAPVYGTGEVV